MDAASAAVLIGALAVAAWSRYLYHKQTMALVERGGDFQTFVEMRERRQVRLGMLFGATLLAIGCVVFVVLRVVPDQIARSDLPTVITAGGSLVAVGLVLLVASLIWSRSPRPGDRPSPRAASGNDSQSGRDEP